MPLWWGGCPVEPGQPALALASGAPEGSGLGVPEGAGSAGDAGSSTGSPTVRLWMTTSSFSGLTFSPAPLSTVGRAPIFSTTSRPSVTRP